MTEAERAAWLAERQTGIGGSDIAAIMGVSPYGNANRVWEEKLGIALPKRDTLHMRRGRALEPVVLKQYQEDTGLRMLSPPGHLIRHPSIPFAVATLDGLSLQPSGDARVVEVKCPGWSSGWGREGTDEIPEPYLLQTQWYLMVAGKAIMAVEPVADVVAWVSGEDRLRYYQVEAMQDLQDMLVEAAANFWDCVEQRRPPVEALIPMEKLLGKRPSRVVRADQRSLERIVRAQEIKRQLAPLEAELDGLKDWLRTAMDQADVMTGPGDRELVTYRESKPGQRIDTKAMAKAHPDVAAAFTVTNKAARPLVIKEA